MRRTAGYGSALYGLVAAVAILALGMTSGCATVPQGTAQDVARFTTDQAQQNLKSSDVRNSVVLLSLSVASDRDAVAASASELLSVLTKEPSQSTPISAKQLKRIDHLILVLDGDQSGKAVLAGRFPWLFVNAAMHDLGLQRTEPNVWTVPQSGVLVKRLDRQSLVVEWRTASKASQRDGPRDGLPEDPSDDTDIAAVSRAQAGDHADLVTVAEEVMARTTDIVDVRVFPNALMLVNGIGAAGSAIPLPADAVATVSGLFYTGTSAEAAGLGFVGGRADTDGSVVAAGGEAGGNVGDDGPAPRAARKEIALGAVEILLRDERTARVAMVALRLATMGAAYAMEVERSGAGIYVYPLFVGASQLRDVILEMYEP